VLIGDLLDNDSFHTLQPHSVDASLDGRFPLSFVAIFRAQQAISPKKFASLMIRFTLTVITAKNGKGAGRGLDNEEADCLIEFTILK
jgi:hypothetical protein